MEQSNLEDLTLVASLHRKDYLTFLALLTILFAYWLGIIQDGYYGVKYFVFIVNSGEISGSFPFMLGWTTLMLWGVFKPIERRIVLLLTGLLVSFMFVENMLLVAASNFEGSPYTQSAGALLWLSAYLIAGRLSKQKQTQG